MRFLNLFSIVLLSCRTDGGKSSVDTASINSESVDYDADGFDSTVDCDDSNSTINPNAVELCDGFDNDCDGEIDEGVLNLFYQDLDMDGFGNPQTNFMRYVFQTAHRINSRFGQFSPSQKDKRVLSVQIFESIVAFFVDRQKSEEESRVIWNHEVSPEDIADDFRHQDQSSFEKSASKIKQLMRRAFSTQMEDPD